MDLAQFLQKGLHAPSCCSAITVKTFFFRTSIDRSISYCVQDVCRACEACVAPFAFEIRFSSPARVIFLALQRRVVGKVLNSADKKELEERRVVYICIFCVSSFDPLALPILCSPPAESVSDSRSIRDVATDAEECRFCCRYEGFNWNPRRRRDSSLIFFCCCTFHFPKPRLRWKLEQLGKLRCKNKIVRESARHS